MTSFADPLQAGIDPAALSLLKLIDADVLVDVPQLMSLARLRYENGTLYEAAVCLPSTNTEDFNSLDSLIPQAAIRLGSRRGMTLGCPCGEELIFSFWHFE